MTVWEVLQKLNQTAPSFLPTVTTAFGAVAAGIPVARSIFNWVEKLINRRDELVEAAKFFRQTVEDLSSPDETRQLAGAILLRRFIDPSVTETRGKNPYEQEALLLIAALTRTLDTGHVQKTLADALRYASSLAGADLQDCDLSNAYLGLKDGERRTLHLERADLYGAKLVRSSFRGVSAARAVFSNTQCEKTVFENAKLENAKFDGAVARKARFGGATLTGASFKGADLSGAEFGLPRPSDSDAPTVKKESANLSGANFEGAQATGALFEGANLTRAVFVRADLSGADLRGAALDGVDFSEATLEGALFSASVPLPAGYTFERRNGVFVATAA